MRGGGEKIEDREVDDDKKAGKKNGIRGEREGRGKDGTQDEGEGMESEKE